MLLQFLVLHFSSRWQLQSLPIGQHTTILKLRHGQAAQAVNLEAMKTPPSAQIIRGSAFHAHLYRTISVPNQQ
jgi:hypothetical protein